MSVRLVSCLSLLFISTAAGAADSISSRTIGLELARDLASTAIQTCRAQGYQVSAVVVDRSGNLRAALRDDLASRFTLQIAEEKANASILAGVDSGEFARNRADIRMEMNHVKGILVLQGGVLIEAAGHRIGALGISGAPGGDKDEACARAALQTLSERLEFAE